MSQTDVDDKTEQQQAAWFLSKALRYRNGAVPRHTINTWKTIVGLGRKAGLSPLETFAKVRDTFLHENAQKQGELEQLIEDVYGLTLANNINLDT